ncbi:hypothetical protein GGTG_01344 [Gaeumannomyces tritici R3-111a-1]|uniref:Uncharacterized protein n=1 Tax=Gaeumannomyces tritici (strain R3-111a-1) TaxID=644352 RepID=J3NJB1_GAET3|nr:hypothetical protein GGTG_01344 [Gaeumannomyces tritici R3-111a-1]EJT81362.1 hypothetical protein GGTG_01344 [Gaeumannomyces tritici R3-111a-1]
MATSHDEPPTFRRDSPSPDLAPTPALGACPELSRCLSTASSASHGSESLGGASDLSALSRHSSGSFQAASRKSDVNRSSIMSMDRPAAKRRGYMRPQGTDFAASARQRESVLSLGSITHLQYYFARTGLLDGKGGQLSRKRDRKARTLDFSQLDSSSFLVPKSRSATDVDAIASLGSSPDLGLTGQGFVESPTTDQHPDVFDDDNDDFYMDEYDDPDAAGMLPPTASTYNHREKPLPKPPSMQELRVELSTALDTAAKSLTEARTAKDPTHISSHTKPVESPQQQAQEQDGKRSRSQTGGGWHEVQGVHILDVVTLAIRAAKVYYTSHDHPDRLDSIKSEKVVRGELLSVMDVLKRMATRNFLGGMREEEFGIMESWIASLRDMLRREDEIVAAERAERAGWTWLRDADWADPARRVDREFAFIQSLLAGGGAFALSSRSRASGSGAYSPGATTPLATTPTTATFVLPGLVPASSTGSSGVVTPPPEEDEPLPAWTPIDRDAPLESQELPTPFLKAMQNGRWLVRLHNAAVRKSQRRFGAIGNYHIDTQKPYRCADNLRYWVKAAELRWEIQLRDVDALAIVYDNSGPAVWLAFEDAILEWCRKVREEITSELRTSGLL